MYKFVCSTTIHTPRQWNQRAFRKVHCDGRVSVRRAPLQATADDASDSVVRAQRDRLNWKLRSLITKSLLFLLISAFLLLIGRPKICVYFSKEFLCPMSASAVAVILLDRDSF